jgi:chloride channel 3/4/5
MPKSVVSFHEDETSHVSLSRPPTTPSSPVTLRRTLSVNDSRGRLPPSLIMTPRETETTGLLSESQSSFRRYESMPTSPRSRQLSRVNSASGSLRRRKHYGHPSGHSSPMWMRTSGLRTPKLSSSMLASSLSKDDRLWYDQFTSTDWVHDSIADGYRVLELKKKRGWRGRLALLLDAAQGWILVAIIGVVTAALAYFVDVTESSIFDIKRGFCRDAWYLSRTSCCAGEHTCDSWRTWSKIIQPSRVSDVHIDYLVFILGSIVLAVLACFITLYSKTVVPSQIASTFDENLGAVKQVVNDDGEEDKSAGVQPLVEQNPLPASIYYSAAGSGVAEVKVILSGFVLHGYLGVRVLILKTVALILSVASGMSLGKEGPYVHIATCVGNIACRLFPKFNLNDGKRREVLSASAAAGVAVAFGSPLGGVLFSLEEVSYYFPSKTLFRTFFCCIVAALSLKFLNPYGTSKIVLFEVRYVTDWHVFELFIFALIGIAGGLAGALFIKASRFWATTFRRISVIKKYPMLEVLLVALITGLISFWNRDTRLAVAELLFELASPCQKNPKNGLCPKTETEILEVVRYLSIAFVVKAFLTIITFGIKVPAGIYVPSMVVGGLMGRIVGHLTQYVVIKLPDFFLWSHCRDSGNIESCVTPGVYALVAAGATMCGVTRLSVTLAVILFELTGSLDHVLPFSLGVLCAKWTADAVEPLSIYDLLTDMNSYPFLDNRTTPVFDSELGDIVSRYRRDKVIDISISPLVKATDLRAKLRRLQNLGELDGGLPILRDKVLVGLIPAPDLEFALDRVEDEDTAFCLLATDENAHVTRRWGSFAEAGYDSGAEDSGDEEPEAVHTTDLTPYIDPAPVALDVHSPMDLVYQCFVKLGLRYICVLSEGEYRGMVHKKAFVRYLKTMEHSTPPR